MSWTDIVGQAFATRLFQAHLAAGTVADAYLLAGPEGVGKRRLALEMAKALNCTADRARPCDVCPTCRQIIRGTHPDVHLVSPGGAADQIRIEAIRQLLPRTALRPFNARVQAAVIDGAERLTEEAANSLLKALEEPPAHTRFFLTTARLSDCLPTIISRCQLVRCRPLPAGVITRLLVETQGVSLQTAEAAARLSGGSAAQAITLAARWQPHEQALARLAAPTPTVWFEQPLPETRQDVSQLLDVMVSWLRDVAVLAEGGAPRVGSAAWGNTLRRQAGAVSADRCVETVFELVSLRESLDQFVSPRLVAALAREKWLSLHGA